MQHRREEVVLTTTHHRITGTITLARDGYRSRVSDLLNATERDFLSLTEATVERLDGTEPAATHPFVTINRHHVVFALLPPDDADGDDTPSQPPPS